MTLPGISRLAGILLCLSAAAGVTSAAPAKGKAAPAIAASVPAGTALRAHVVREAYALRNFDKVVAEIEAFTKANKSFARTDSLFIARHLSVIYGAKAATRARGMYHMYRLLEMDPAATLDDLFPSQDAQVTFAQVRLEFQRQQGFIAANTPRKDALATDSAAAPAPESAPAHEARGITPEERAKARAEAEATTPVWKRKGVWLAGGAGLAAIGAWVTYAHMNSEEEARRIRLGNQVAP